MLGISLHALAQTAIFAAIELDKSIRGKSQKLENFLKIQQWLLATKNALSTKKTKEGHPKWYILPPGAIPLIKDVLIQTGFSSSCSAKRLKDIQQCNRYIQQLRRKVNEILSLFNQPKENAEKLKAFCSQLSKTALQHEIKDPFYRRLAA